VGSALRDHDFPDRRSALDARLALASVGAVQKLESAALALGVHIIRDRRAPVLDRSRQNILDGAM
jgi:hypothetical protein